MSTKKMLWIAAGIAAGVGAIWFVTRRRLQWDVPGWASWQKVLAEKHGPAEVEEMGGQVRQRFMQLCAAQSWPANEKLRWHLAKNILPGLALYQVLLEKYNGDQPAALAEVDAAFRAWTLAKSRGLVAPLKVFPEPFKLFRLVFGGMMKRFPAEGWDFAFVENSDERIAFNASRCFYLNTLTALGAPELTPSFCKTDEVMAELFPPEVRFVRAHTLGRGDALCDFQYCRVQPE